LEHFPKIPHEEKSNASLAQTTIKIQLVAKQPFIPELSTMQLSTDPSSIHGLVNLLDTK